MYRKNRRQTTQWSTVIGRHGQVAFPPNATEFYVGCRVFFWIYEARVEIRRKPKVWPNGRYCTRRVRRISLVKQITPIGTTRSQAPLRRKSLS